MKILAALALLAVAGCATTPAASRDFFTDLSSLCGKSFAGRITSPPAPADADFAGKAMVMQVRECSADTIRVPFHVADDYSRTWVITRIASGLRLKHDHRHKDGSEDKVTQYGGDSVTPVSAARQEFPADQFTKNLLIREGNTAGANNVWAVEVIPGRTFAYELRRPGRFFRVEFDLTRPVPTPPAPRGSR
ncbi:MAG: hypothetical protein V4696_09670 [Pseudomonadota bacterium]